MKKIILVLLIILNTSAFCTTSTDSLKAVKKWGQWLAQFDLQPGNAVVSLGAGNGWREFELSLLTNNITFYLEDLDSVSLNQANLNKAKKDFAQSRKSALTNSFYTLYGTTQSIPTKNEMADKVLIMNSYHHFDKKDDMLREIHRTLKSGGKLIITDHISLDESKESSYGCDHNYFLLNEKDLVDQINKAGFKLISVTKMAKMTRLFVFGKLTV